ncbi:MAG: CRISPR-associated endonuclease Cas2 [Myxococcota bacterium]
MRARYLVSYDISDAKRWRKLYRTLRGFGDAIHYSVFQCDLSATEHVLLRMKLVELIHHEQDRVMIVHLGPVDGRVKERIEVMGRPGQSGPLERIAVVI